MITDKIFATTLKVYIDNLEKYNELDFKRKENPETWSLAQLYEHLIISNEWYFNQLEACFGHQNNLNKSMSSTALKMFQQNSFPTEKLIWDQPDPENDLISKETIKTKLQSDLERSQLLWKRIKSEIVFGKVKHPGFLYLSPIEWYQFTEMHLRHHLKQLKA